MANSEHIAVIKQGAAKWNTWRTEHPGVQPDLSGENFSKADLSRADLREVDLRRADLSEAILFGAIFIGANLHRANLHKADLCKTIMVETDLTNANLTGCYIYGISAWDLKLDNATQQELIITKRETPNAITTDNLEVAQFIYLLLNNQHIRKTIETITSKVVLILGRFTPERKAVLDAIRKELRTRDYLPLVFDFEKPASRDITETVSTLAHMAKFVIADITDAKSIPQELSFVVPNLPSVPVQPLLLESQREYSMYEHFARFPWVLPIAFYKTQDELLDSLEQKVIAPAETKLKEIRATTGSAGRDAQQ